MPAREQLIEGYARAFLDVAEAEGELETVEDELFRFSKGVEASASLRDALTNPALPTERKKAVLEELLSAKSSRVTLNLLSFIVEQGHALELDKIVEGLAELAAQKRSHSFAEVRSAVALTEQQRDRLEAALSTASGQRIELKALVDPTVIGGAVARIGDQVFDGTVRTRLEIGRAHV